MIMLRKMRQAEFPAFSEYFIEDYSQEIALNYGRSITDALVLAEQDLSKSFPTGVDSDSQVLLCIETSINQQNTLIGYLWYSINAEDQTAFICDFYINEPHRSKQFGRHAMSELEERLKNDGIHQIKLRVAYHNKRAFALYEKIGFVVTGYNMSKNIV
ncbi:GNAT family N-acetyltransferase [Marinomonas rhizomae]|uniref:GNAT family N-acetyltransferase n=1 Tax=Marinomonas rhizomae TaxID=491948 RepID=UPI002101DB5A|nr:GNAT family N-acetyltransferase [Marinomonas rhizomae]UTW00773.1 GNAT family N-acetyltransferase [Marinomonas rhizomae]